MLTDKEIQELITTPKTIITREPAKGYKHESGNQRCDLTLNSTENEKVTFLVFIRQNTQFIENYSIGLRYKTKNKALGTVTLVRYNGLHGETDWGHDGHYNNPHIHRITAEELKSGNIHPQESHRKTTDKYNTLEEAIEIFFNDMNVVNWSTYFPQLKLTQKGVFDEH